MTEEEQVLEEQIKNIKKSIGEIYMDYKKFTNSRPINPPSPEQQVIHIRPSIFRVWKAMKESNLDYPTLIACFEEITEALQTLVKLNEHNLYKNKTLQKHIMKCLEIVNAINTLTKSRA